jgi:hypothetical protein
MYIDIQNLFIMHNWNFVPFSNCLLFPPPHLHKIFSRSINVVSGRISFLFKVEYYSLFIYSTISSSVHPSVTFSLLPYPGYCKFCWNEHRHADNLFKIQIHFLLSIYPQMGLLDHIVLLFFFFFYIRIYSFARGIHCGNSKYSYIVHFLDDSHCLSPLSLSGPTWSNCKRFLWSISYTYMKSINNIPSP